jgi:hypothetical protein
MATTKKWIIRSSGGRQAREKQAHLAVQMRATADPAQKANQTWMARKRH